MHNTAESERVKQYNERSKKYLKKRHRNVPVCTKKPTEVIKSNEGRICLFFYLMTHSTNFIYGFVASAHIGIKDHIAKEETRCRHYMGYSFRLAARILLYV